MKIFIHNRPRACALQHFAVMKNSRTLVGRVSQNLFTNSVFCHSTSGNRALRFAGILSLMTVMSFAELVPGTGQKIVLENFEAPNWTFNPNFPKSSREQDGRTNLPIGTSLDGRVTGSDFRGEPDVVEQVELSDGSHGLKMSTCRSDVRGSFASGLDPKTVQPQDDLMIRTPKVHVNKGPSAVVYVYVPPFEKWEQRLGSSFGFRVTTVSEPYKKESGKRAPRETDPYWPGMFILLGQDPQTKEKYGFFQVRADENGQTYQPKRAPYIRKEGWWTLGISFTPDHMVHYFAKPGKTTLTAADHIVSHQPYKTMGINTDYASTVFFNICNDGITPSTEWIIDDPTFFIANPNAQETVHAQQSGRRRRGGSAPHAPTNPVGDSRR